MVTLQGLTKAGKDYFDKLSRMQSIQVRVGFSSDKVYPDGNQVAQVAADNEFGDSNRPPRPFMRQSFENHKDRLENACMHLQGVVTDGGDLNAALDETGEFLVGLVQEEIVEGGFAPNAPYTIARKGSSQPLIDTGHMRQSVGYQIVENAK
jgi:hypothetical protein